MRVMLLLHENDEIRARFTAPESADLIAELTALLAELRASGEFVVGEPFTGPRETRTVRIGQDGPVVADGPLADVDPWLGGYLIVDVASMDRAVEIAGRWPSARFGPIEVRRILEA